MLPEAIASGRFDVDRKTEERAGACGGLRRLVAHRPRLGGGGAGQASRGQGDGAATDRHGGRQRCACPPGRLRGARLHQERRGVARIGPPADPRRPLAARQGGECPQEHGRCCEAGPPRHAQGGRHNRRAPPADRLGRSCPAHPRPSWPTALFAGLLRNSIKGIDPKLLYPAIRAVSKNADGMARAQLVQTLARTV